MRNYGQCVTVSGDRNAASVQDHSSGSRRWWFEDWSLRGQAKCDQKGWQQMNLESRPICGLNVYHESRLANEGLHTLAINLNSSAVAKGHPQVSYESKSGRDASNSLLPLKYQCEFQYHQANKSDPQPSSSIIRKVDADSSGQNQTANSRKPTDKIHLFSMLLGSVEVRDFIR
jgi:hypothetical protein